MSRGVMLFFSLPGCTRPTYLLLDRSTVNGYDCLFWQDTPKSSWLYLGILVCRCAEVCWW